MKINLHYRAGWIATALVVLSGATLAMSQEKPTNTLELATNQLRLELSNTLTAIHQTNRLMLSGVRHSRIATESGFFILTNKSAFLRIAPSGATVVPGDKRIGFNTEAAEAINASAMRDFQRRFELKLKEPTTPLWPNLYPAQTQRILEIR